MPQICELDLGHADAIRHADLNTRKRILNARIYECLRRPAGIEHAKVSLDARGVGEAEK